MPPSVDATAVVDDPYLWLEELASPAVDTWREQRNAETLSALGDAQFDADRRTILDLLNADDRIPWIRQRGKYIYNFWQDAAHPKGLWRRTTLAEFRKSAPDWDVLLDLDALAKAEAEDWVWRGCEALPPDFNVGLVMLSRGGADAAVVREFDLAAKRFVSEGFELSEGKLSALAWIDRDELLVASALGGEAFQTQSGYARTVRRWRRGTAFSEAPTVFECARTDMWAYVWVEHTLQHRRAIFVRGLDFIRHEYFLEEPFAADRRRIDVPLDAFVGVYRDVLVLNLRSDWQLPGHTCAAGALLAIGLASFMQGDRDFAVLFQPSPDAFLQYFERAGDAIGFKVLDHVQSRVMIAHCLGGNEWQVRPLEGLPKQSVIDLQPLHVDDSSTFVLAAEGELFVVSAQNAVTPPTMSLVRFGEAPNVLRRAPARFDSSGLVITQHHADAADGTRIPYFQVASAELNCDGSNAVLMTGYGGFQISSLPYYALGTGKLWLERGGVHVIANIRGGGEFGPAWHRAGIREGKIRSHDDFAAVARDLVVRRVTRPSRLACWGGSNGGLLVANMYARYGDLFGAIICDVPLTDMRRYTRLTAGPSWVAEYGDPDKPEDWAFMRAISAYHTVSQKGPYPPILITTSARDDRVHPGHARKMAAKLAAFGHRVYFREPPEGGHAGAADNAHLAYNIALGYSFLRHTIAPEMTAAVR